MCRIGSIFWRIKRHVNKRSEYEPLIEDAENEGTSYYTNAFHHILCVCVCVFVRFQNCR